MNMMKLKRILQVGIFVLSCLVISGCGRVKVYKLYYLGGQSNMDGYGQIKDLPPDLNKPVDGVVIFHGDPAPDGVEPDGKGIWATLKPGHGAGFTSDRIKNNYSDQFGVELTFGKRMKELYPKSNIAIIKYSRGGTSIDSAAAGEAGCWQEIYTKGNGINQYDHFLATVKNAYSFTDINGDGKVEELVPSGIVWMQGESDANLESSALKYEENLTNLMRLIRKAFLNDNLPVAIGRISDSGKSPKGKVWAYGDIVRIAQADFVKKDRKAVLVTSTDSYAYSDPWHYDSKGFIDLGNKFAEALYSISKKK
jgi:hypothetical protein